MVDNFGAMSDTGDFKAHQALGRRGGIRFLTMYASGIRIRRRGRLRTLGDGRFAVYGRGLPRSDLALRFGLMRASGPMVDAAVEVVRRSGVRVGRPRIEGVRPWEAAGVSRRTWFRRKKAEGC